MVRAVAGHRNVIANSRGEFTNLVFLHHSVGANLIAEGHLRDEVTKDGYTFYDHGYNSEGLTGPDGIALGYSYSVPGDNTDPEGFAEIFTQKVYNLPINTLSSLLQHEVIIIKSCFTGSQIPSDEQLEMDKASYLEIRESMAKHPNTLFIILTSPPLNPAETSPDEARRAYELAGWLAAPGFIAGYDNIYIFDLYGLLAEDTPGAKDEYMLTAKYRNGADSHPNQAANDMLGPALSQFINDTVQSFKHQ